MSRKKIPKNEETIVLTKSRRRCAICFGLDKDTETKRGQIAHLDRDPSNNDIDNLSFLCLSHHDEYDSRTSQSKGLKEEEVRQYREELYAFVESEDSLEWPDYPTLSAELRQSDTIPERVPSSPEVYDRKIAFYKAFQELLNEVFVGTDISMEALRKFARATDEAIFVFDLYLAEYLNKLYKNAVRLHFIGRRLDNLGDSRRENQEKLLTEQEELLNWFGDQYQQGRRLFSRYIYLR